MSSQQTAVSPHPNATDRSSIHRCYIHGIGTAVPEQVLHQEDATELFTPAFDDRRTLRLMRRVAKLTGIRKRHLAVLDYQRELDGREPVYKPRDIHPDGPGMTARNDAFDEVMPPLVTRCLDQLPSEQLAAARHMVTCSCTHASSPGLEQPVFAHGHVDASVSRYNLGFMGCSAGLAAVRLVHGLAASGADALVVACEVSSLHFQYSSELDQLTANMLFSDGAAALTLSPKPGPVEVVDARCAAVPAHADQMVWFATNNGLGLILSQELPTTLAAHLPATVESMLADHGLTVGDIDHWLVHPGGPQILDAVESAMGLAGGTVDGSRAVFEDYGNMSSPTILFILQQLVASGASGRCVAVAFGPGLTIELVLLNVA